MQLPVWFKSRKSAVTMLVPAITIGILSSPVAGIAKDQNTPAAASSAKPSAKAETGKAEPGKAGPGKAEPKEQTIILGDKLAVVKLSKEFRFVEPERAIAFLKEQGSSGEGVLGIIAPQKDSPDTYFVVCRYEDCGYVTEDDADKINPTELLNSFKEANKEQNEERIEQKIQPYYVGGWAEQPRYDKASHQMIWAIEVKDVDSPEAPVDTINYNTRMLGRRGVLSMNLVTDPKELALGKTKVATLLQNVKYNKGQTYAEYVPGTDKAAGYGLAGLILGGGAMAAAAKLGVFGALWKWGLGIILVLKKFIIVAIAGLAAVISKLFKGKNKGTDSGYSASSDAADGPAPESKASEESKTAAASGTPDATVATATEITETP